MNKRVRKAVITAAGKGTRHYPATNAVQKELFPLVDHNGASKPTIQLVVEEALAAGMEEICIITQPGGDVAFKQHFQGLYEKEGSLQKPWARAQASALANMQSRISYIYQSAAEGFGHAVYCSREWVGDEPFMLFLGDHVYLAPQKGYCSRQLMPAYERFGKSVFGAQQSTINQLHLFGTICGGSLVQDNPRIWKVASVHEKPEPDFARQNLSTAGLEPDRFLTFFGLYLFTPAIFKILQEHIEKDVRERGEIQLTSAQAVLAAQEGAMAVEVAGTRLDMGTPLGYLATQLVLAMNGPLADELKRMIDPANLIKTS